MDDDDARARIGQLVDEIDSQVIERGPPDWSAIAGWALEIAMLAQERVPDARGPVF